jgi:type I restriction enzyme S subunit
MKGTAKNDGDGLMDTWSQCPLESIAQTTSGGTPDRKRAEFYGGEIPWVKSGELNDSYIFSTEETLTPEGLKHSSAKLFPVGTLLMAMYGATVGKTAILKTDAATNQAVCAIFPDREKADTDFLRYFLIGERPELLKQRYGGAQPNISQNVIRNFPIRHPPLPEQRKIAGVLGVVQRAMEQQERLLALTAELKKAFLHKLFTEGLRGEPQKQTEIGPVPESWGVATLESVAVAFDYGTSVKCEHGKAGVPVLRIPNVVGGSIDLSDLKHGQPKRSELDQLRLQDGDLLFVRTNGVLENAGRCALYRGELEDCYFASYLIRVRVDSSKVLPAFVNEYARTERGRSLLSGRAIRTADGKFNINSGTLKRVLLPLPSIEEQKEVVCQLDLVERKLKLHGRKHATLTALFRTLLHQLMTAQIRVHDLDLEGVLS